MLRCAPRALLALRGLQGDVQTLLEDVSARLELRRLEEGPDAMGDPKSLAALLSIMLYGGRLQGGGPGYVVEPVVCGLRRDGAPYLCAQDGLGAKLESATFVVAGTAATSLYGSCEALYTPDLAEDDLLDAALAAMAAGLDRDCMSGRNVVVHVLSPAGHATFERTLKTTT